MVDELLQIDNERKYELLNLKINLTNNDELDKLFFEYSKKYLYSANLINEYLINDSNDIYELDIYFYSMMYLYRHSIELLIKAIIIKENGIDSAKTIINNMGHNLIKGIDTIKKLNTFKDLNNIVDNVLSLCKQLNEFDSTSERTRYPFFKGEIKTPTYPRQISYDLRNIYKNINNVASMFEYIYINNQLPSEKFNIVINNGKLMINGKNYFEQSVCGYRYGCLNFYPFVNSYRDASNFLNERINEENKTMVFIPMMCLYRITLELELKTVISDIGTVLYGKEQKEIVDFNHNLKNSWEYIKFLDLNFFKDYEKFIEEVSFKIEIIHDFDCYNKIFLYPCDQNMRIYFKKDKNKKAKEILKYMQEAIDLVDTLHFSIIDRSNFI